MNPKRVVIRERANVDIDGAVDHYLAEGGQHAAERFIEPLEAAFRQIAAFPGTGSPRYGIELNVPDLRSWPLQRYPLLVFYIERGHGVEVLRVLHTHRDISPLLA